MQIAFETEELRDLCLKADVAEARVGAAHTASLFAALADIRAAATAIELFMGEFIEASENVPPMIRIAIGSYGKLLLVSNQVRHNGPNAEGVDWSQVKRVRIMEVVPHGA
ncbi:MAG: hypothetical protein ABNH49_11940 [Hyphomonas sp.]